MQRAPAVALEKLLAHPVNVTHACPPRLLPSELAHPTFLITHPSLHHHFNTNIPTRHQPRQPQPICPHPREVTNTIHTRNAIPNLNPLLPSRTHGGIAKTKPVVDRLKWIPVIPPTGAPAGSAKAEAASPKASSAGWTLCSNTTRRPTPPPSSRLSIASKYARCL